MMKSIYKNVFLGAMATLVVGLSAETATAQSELDAFKKKGEELLREGLKDPKVKDLVKSVKDNPDSALKGVSSMARDAAGRVPGGIPNLSGKTDGVPATRSQATTQAPVTQPATPPLTVTPPATTSNPPAAVPSMIPEPVARGARPEPVNPATQQPSSIQNAVPAMTPQPTQVVAAAGYVPPRPLEPRYRERAMEDRAMQAKEGQDMEVISDSSEMNQETGLMVFEGNVVVIHPSYNLKCDRLEIFMYREGEAPAKKANGENAEFKKAIATGGMVVIDRFNAKGEKETAKSRKAEFMPLKDLIVLTGGPPTIQSGTNLVEQEGADAKIIMNLATKNYSVEGGRNRQVFKIGGGKTPTIGIPGGSLEDQKKPR